MNTFYITMMMIGSLLIILTLVTVMFDRKSGIDYEEKLRFQKNELMQVIDDSEVMLHELNRLSEHVIDQVDKKINDFNNTFQNFVIPKKVAVDNEQDQNISVTRFENEDESNSKKEIKKESNSKRETQKESNSKKGTQKGIKRETKTKKGTQNEVKTDVEIETEIPKYDIKNKYNDVLVLAEKGYSDVEIAKALNMGKGEIQLILGMNILKMKVPK